MKNNKLIAEFMGISIDGEFAYIKDEGSPLEETMPINQMEYHNSWDWLMPVVDKCFQYGELHNSYREQIIASLSGVIDIEDTYKAVVEFIEWYNKN